MVTFSPYVYRIQRNKSESLTFGENDSEACLFFLNNGFAFYSTFKIIMHTTKKPSKKFSEGSFIMHTTFLVRSHFLLTLHAQEFQPVFPPGVRFTNWAGVFDSLAIPGRCGRLPGDSTLPVNGFPGL